MQTWVRRSAPRWPYFLPAALWSQNYSRPDYYVEARRPWDNHRRPVTSAQLFPCFPGSNEIRLDTAKVALPVFPPQPGAESRCEIDLYLPELQAATRLRSFFVQSSSGA